MKGMKCRVSAFIILIIVGFFIIIGGMSHDTISRESTEDDFLICHVVDKGTAIKRGGENDLVVNTNDCGELYVPNINVSYRKMFDSINEGAEYKFFVQDGRIQGYDGYVEK